jgi:hypothetical protein
MITSDRRISRRLSLRFNMSYRRHGSDAARTSGATLRNVSMGGICFRTTDDTLEAGTVIEIVLHVPPRHGVLERGGRISGLARVLWSSRDQGASDCVASVVGAQFCERPGLVRHSPSKTS